MGESGVDVVTNGERTAGKIFISYRRTDVPHAAGRLFDHLERRFGADNVFMDVDSIELGVDFRQAIAEEVGSCDVLLAVIGPNWLRSVDDRGRRRLDDAADLVADEIGAALERGIRVIPLLVDGATAPRSDDLPEPLAPLAERQASALAHDGFRVQVTELVARLESALAVGQADPEPEDLAAEEDEFADGPARPITARWTVEDLGLLVRDPRTSSQRIAGVLDVLAEKPDVELSTSDLVDLTGMTRNQLRGTFSGFSRVCRSLHPDVDFWWPIGWTWGPSNHTGRGRETFYCMSPTMAERWKQARREACGLLRPSASGR
jgi:hypothetical protein